MTHFPSWVCSGNEWWELQGTRLIIDMVNDMPRQVCVFTNWGRVTHICASKLTIIGSDNGLSPGRHQAITWTNVGILLIGPLGTNISEILIEIYIHNCHWKKCIWKCRQGIGSHLVPASMCFIVARLKEPRDHNVGILENKSTLLTISRLWRYCGPSNYRFNFLLYWYAPWVFFEVVNVLSCSPFMFENTENKQLGWRIRHSHLASTLFHSLVPWLPLRRIRPQIIRLSQLENSAMGTWPIYKNSIIPDWFEKWRDMNSDTGVNCVVPQNYDMCPLLMMHKTCSINYGHLADLQKNTSYNWS